MRESQYLEVFEDLCNGEWSGYGVKDVDGIHMLSGPGLSAEGHMSMMYGGKGLARPSGLWPRLILVFPLISRSACEGVEALLGSISRSCVH